MSTTTAIVAEGGGQRGIYTAGVLDAFLKASFNPFTLGVGTSAGAQNLLAYFLKQPGYARRAVLDLTSRPDFLVPRRGLLGLSMMDLDGYFETSLSDPQYRLPYADISTVQRDRKIQFVATDRHKLSPVYLNPDEHSVLNDLKASSAVPYFYREGVERDGRRLMDGGISDPIPVVRAYDQGARRIVVIRTAPLHLEEDIFRSWQRLIPKVVFLSVRPANLNAMMQRYRQALRASLAFIDNPPANLAIHVIAPRAKLNSRVLASRRADLLADYELGFADGMQAMTSLEHMASATAPVVVRSSVDA